MQLPVKALSNLQYQKPNQTTGKNGPEVRQGSGCWGWQRETDHSLCLHVRNILDEAGGPTSTRNRVTGDRKRHTLLKGRKSEHH